MDDRTRPIGRRSIDLGGKPAAGRREWDIEQFGSILFEQTGECVFIIGMDLHYLAANRQALNLLGYEEHELVGMSVSDVMTMEELLEKKPAGGDQPNIYERILKRKDGVLIPVEVSASLVSDQNSIPVYIQSIVRDITERKAGERLLKRNSRILSVISEATARLFRSSNIQSRIPEVLESLGHALETFCCVLFEVDSFSGAPQVRIGYKWISQDSQSFDVERAIQPFVNRILTSPEAVFSEKSAGGTTEIPSYSFLAIPIQGTLGSWGFLGLFDRENALAWLPADFDTIQTAANLIGAAMQRLQYEETIRLNDSRNRAIVEALPDLLIRINLDGVILDYSTNPDHALYIHRDIISGKKLNETWPEDVVERILGTENQNAFLAPRWVEGFQLPFSSSVYESRLHPVNAQEALIIVRDITDMINLNEMKTDFINRASHELRTPLTAVILMADLIQQGGTAEELDEYWRTMRNELNRQKSLIDRLLMAGRLESGMVKLEALPMDLLPVLQESIQAVRPIANKKKVELPLDAPSGPIHILGEQGALEQVFINLINNATKFSPEGSTVQITVTRTGDNIDITIEDQGMGIAPEALSHLFEKFYRAKNVTIAEIPGSGIGLYIVKSIIEELGGKIEVKSELNKGTTFIVHLKAA
jgi:PAS domain S-box-containing protein